MSNTLSADEPRAGSARSAPAAARHVDDSHVFTMQMLHVGRQVLRVGRTTGDGRHPPQLLFNGIGGNIELPASLALAIPEREVLTFDIPGVGHSLMPKRPYRLRDVARLAGERAKRVVKFGGMPPILSSSPLLLPWTLCNPN